MRKSLLLLLTLVTLMGCATKDEKPAGDPEARVVAYTNKIVPPGKPVLVTDLYNNVFTEPEEQAAVKRLYDAVFQMPAFVAMRFTESGKIPTLMEITTHFNFKV